MKSHSSQREFILIGNDMAVSITPMKTVPRGNNFGWASLRVRKINVFYFALVVSKEKEYERRTSPICYLDSSFILLRTNLIEGVIINVLTIPTYEIICTNFWYLEIAHKKSIQVLTLVLILKGRLGFYHTLLFIPIKNIIILSIRTLFKLLQFLPSKGSATPRWFLEIFSTNRGSKIQPF